MDSIEEAMKLLNESNAATDYNYRQSLFRRAMLMLTNIQASKSLKIQPEPPRYDEVFYEGMKLLD